MAKQAKISHEGTPGLRRLGKLLGGAIDEARPSDSARGRKEVFDLFFRTLGKDEEHAREVFRFWFEQAYPAQFEKQVAWQKKQAAKK